MSQPTTEGVARDVAALIEDQTGRGWTVALASPPSAELEALCNARSARHHVWDARRSPGPSVLSEMRSLRRIVREVAPDVVHLHSSKAGMVGRLVLRGRLPTVFMPHAWSWFVGGRATRVLALRWERWAARWTDIFLCVSEAERRRGDEGGVRGTFRVVPNAVDLEAFRPASEGEREDLRTRLGLGGPTAVCVGRLIEQKGQDLLVDVWPSVREAIPDAELVLVGDGPARAALERDAGPGVRMVGDQQRVRDWLVAADVVAMPSRWEGLSLVALEALASGCSIVASRADGMSEVLGDGSEGVGALVPVGDEAALRSAIVERLGSPVLRDAERVRSRARAARFGTAGWGDRIAAVLVEATRRDGSAP